MNSKKLFIIVTLFISVSLIFTFGYAQMKMHQHEEHQHSGSIEGKEVTITGHVIDPLCYVTMNMVGEKHKKCAVMCAKNGVNLGILEKDTEIIYLAFPEGHGNPNEKLMAFIEEDVKVTGNLWEKGGLKAIRIQKVEKVK